MSQKVVSLSFCNQIIQYYFFKLNQEKIKEAQAVPGLDIALFVNSEPDVSKETIETLKNDLQDIGGKKSNCKVDLEVGLYKYYLIHITITY